jgi:hypothetical protein
MLYLVHYISYAYSRSFNRFVEPGFTLQEDRENILRARESGKGALTNPFRLLESKHLGVVFTFAVYCTDLHDDATPEDRVKATAGYTSTVSSCFGI